MGIYPEESYQVQKGGILLHSAITPGLERVAVYQQIAYIENRTNCFCCSCPGYPYGGDAACRNHGWAAARPCEEHNMPGSTWEDDDTMPDSVQAHRRRNAGIVA